MFCCFNGSNVPFAYSINFISVNKLLKIKISLPVSVETVTLIKFKS